MEIQVAPAEQLSKINIDRATEAVPAREPFRLHALEVRQGIADVLKIEGHSLFLQARPFPSPGPEEMAVWTLTGFVAVRAREWFLLRGLRTDRQGEQANTDAQGKQEPPHKRDIPHRPSTEGDWIWRFDDGTALNY